MKDKILYKSQKQNIISMMLSLILTGVTLAVGKVAILPIYYNLYYGKLGAFGQSIGKIIYNIRHGILSREILLIIIFTTIFFIWFIILTRKRERHLNNTMKLVKGMANGNEFSTLNESFKGQYGDFSRNINCIIKRLQNSLEEQMIIEKTKSDLITNVSHDLRTPLTSVIGYLSIIDEDKCRDEVEIRQYVNIAYEKAKGLNILINDLFELTRMRTPSVGIKYSEINMCELLGQISANFYPMLRDVNMEVRLQIPENNLMACVDSQKIVRALENLIINAINYGKEGKYIDISLENTMIQDKEYFSICVKNSGEISQIDLPHLFDRFYRVEKSRSLVTGGSGLGLAITKSIIDLHSGDISVYSSNGKTGFIINIPIFFQEK